MTTAGSIAAGALMGVDDERRPEVPGHMLVTQPPARGRTARVYRGVSLADGSAVAVKVLTASVDQGEFLEEAFRRETQALTGLKHPGIVRMLGSGVTGDGERYILLDWHDRDLVGWKREGGWPGWEPFWAAIGRPLTVAVAHAHAGEVAHRDLAPRNVLMTTGGAPLVADFGIAKIRRFLRSEQTLRQFVSPPFTPPEADDGSGTYARDVFSLATLFCWAASDAELATYRDVSEFAAASDAFPAAVRDVLVLALSPDQDERPATAEELLDRLDAAATTTSTPAALSCQLSLGVAQAERIAREFGLGDRRAAEQAILEDLNAACGIEPKAGRAGAPGTAFGDLVLYGLTRSYHVRVAEVTADRFVVLGARENPSGWLEARREAAVAPRVEFRFSARGPAADRRAVLDVQQIVDEHLRDREVDEGSEEGRLFDAWSRILRARQDLELSRERPIRYHGHRADGRRVVFRIAGGVPEGSILEKRQVRLEDGTFLEGHIEDLDGQNATFLVTRGDPEQLRGGGEIVVNVYAASEALRKQQRALDLFRDRKVERAHLADVLLDPSRAAPVVPVAPPSFFQGDLDEDKRAAIEAALGSPDVMLLRGPPGTGKTTFIAELVIQTLRADPDARILLCSQTNVAVDNAVERIAELRDSASLAFEIVRLGTNDERIADSVDAHRLPRRLQAWTDEVSGRVRKFAERREAASGVVRHEVVVGMALELLLACVVVVSAASARIAEEEAELERVSGGRKGEADPRVDLDVAGGLAGRRLEIAQLKERRKGARELAGQIRDELATLGERELAASDGADLRTAVDLYLGGSPAISGVRPLIELGADWIARFGRQDHFEAPFLSTVHVVSGTCLGVVGPRSAGELRYDLCIVDEASKATATEMLVPLARASRWVLVGDSRQLPPFQDEAMRDPKLLERYELSREEVAESLFGYMERLLPAGNVLSLTTQRRMIQPINDLVRDCFYPGERLDCARDGPDRRFGPAMKAPVTWIDTSRSARAGETAPRSGNGCFNRLECELVGKRLKQLNRQFQRRDPKVAKGRVTVAVITGYADQLAMLDRTLNPRAASWTHLDILLNTVDAFQGRQADMVVYSVARSNRTGFLGFLRELPRLNVALSRGRDALLIVGDMRFCEGAREPNPFKEVIRWVRRNDVCFVEVVE